MSLEAEADLIMLEEVFPGNIIFIIEISICLFDVCFIIILEHLGRLIYFVNVCNYIVAWL